MAGNFDEQKENEGFEDTDEFDLDLELEGLTSFLHEMGVELEDEVPLGDEITGGISFDFDDRGRTASEDVLESLLFGPGGNGPEAGTDAGESEFQETPGGAGTRVPENGEKIYAVEGADNAAGAYRAERADALEGASRIYGTPDRGDTSGMKNASGRDDMPHMDASDGGSGMKNAPGRDDMAGVDALDGGSGMKNAPGWDDMAGADVSEGESDMSDVFDMSETDDVFDIADSMDMFYAGASDGTPGTDDADGAYDRDASDVVFDTDALNDLFDVDDADAAENEDVSRHTGNTDDSGSKEVKKVEKEVDKVLRKTFGKPFSWKREVLSWAAMFAIAFALAFVIDNYLIVNATVPTDSMQNTIMAGDRMIGWRLSYLFSEPERGDIIIFEYPDNPEEIYVKRVIGLPGETVTISDGKIYINDSTEPLEEDYLPEEWVWKNDGYTFVVPENSYLCLGDNRNNSHDARSWTNTYVTRDAILGQAILCYWPIEDFSWLN